MGRKLLGLLIIIVTIRLIILHHAVRSLPDEYFYNHSLFALSQLQAGNIQGFLFDIFAAVRPGYNILMLVPAFTQGLAYVLFDVDPRSSISLLIPQVCNALAGLAMLLIYYKLLSLYISRKWLVASCVIIYALLVHNTVYTVHLFPYSYASCLILWLTYRFLQFFKNSTVPSNRQLALFGSALAWSFLVYPGYYLIIPFFFISLLILFRSYKFKEKVIPFTAFGIAFVANIAFFQLLSLIGNTNYLIKCSRLSKTIIQGSFDEGFTFIYKYFGQVEHIPFIFVIAVLIYYLFQMSMAVIRNGAFLSNGLFLLFIYGIAMYLYSSINIYFFHKQVNYGRLLQLYYPIIFTVICVVIDSLGKRPALVLSGVLFAAVFVNLMAFYLNASRVAYPLALAEKFKINISASTKLYTHQSPLSYLSYDTLRQNKALRLLNFSYFTDMAYVPQNVPWQDTLLFKPHFLNLKVYQYEGFGILERQTIDAHPIYTGIFRN